jgi:uncharacterized protein
MNRILCLAFVMSASLLTGASPVLAGMSEGVAAITVGDYPRAISEFEPLAASGDAAAQYQLAKLYLEGHGPADGVARGVELMTKSAKANHPEAQAQLGLMYAMGLGVPVDNAQAYAWLSKAVDALPDGTRRAVAQANRDAVQKRLKPDQANVIASAPAASSQTAPASAAPAAKPAATEAAATKTAPTPPPAPAKTTTAPAKATTAEAAPAKAAVVEPKPAEKTAAAKPAKPAASEPVEVAAKPAATQASTAPAATVTEASNKPAKAPDTSTQVASAKAPEPASATPKASGPASAEAVQSAVRIQIASLPSEEAAWSEWKRLSGQFGPQLSGLTAIVQSADLGEQGTFYRIQTGPFDTVAAAEQRCSAMKEAGLSCLVIAAK